ncbi:Protein RTM1 [Colletotrichum siamense]|nr:Protein RTM1 [Colletotrichum siamense]
MAAAAFFTSAFGLSAVLHLGQAVYFKTRCMIPLVVGAFFETVGYSMRCLSASENFGCWSLPPFIIHSILVLVAPAVIAASVYMLLEKIIRLADGDSCSILSPRWITRIFVAGDVASFLIQSYGQHIVLAGGLVVQVAFGVLFTIVAGIFHRRICKAFTAASVSQEIRWLVTLYGVMVLVTIRNIFRIAEHSSGQDSSLMKNEYLPYLFDATPILLALLWFNWYHPYKMKKTAPFGYPLTSTAS